MKKKLIIIYFFIFFVGFPTNVLAQIQNKIILKVENKIITNYEIKNKILSTLMLAGDEINQDNINKYTKVIQKNTFLDTSYDVIS